MDKSLGRESIITSHGNKKLTNREIGLRENTLRVLSTYIYTLGKNNCKCQ